MNPKYIYLECVSTSFLGKDGKLVNGYTVYILERIANSTGKVYFNVIRQWTNVPCSFTFGSVLDCTFDSRGKLIHFEDRGLEYGNC